jgi:hypothetical protein
VVNLPTIASVNCVPLKKYGSPFWPQENAIARNGFFLTLFISLISLATALLTLIYAQRRVFSPLIKDFLEWQ